MSTPVGTRVDGAVEQFLCPGCINGPNPRECEAFDPQLSTDFGASCRGWSPATWFGMPHPLTRRALGLPTGFDKVAAVEGQESHERVRLFVGGDKCAFDEFNVPVWALVKDGWLFVRVYMPRRGYGYVAVIEGGALDDAPGARDVSTIEREMD